MNTKDIEDLVKRLNIKADMKSMGEGIKWGSDIEIMWEAADVLTTLTQHHEAKVREAYERGVADGTDKPLLAIENVREAERERIKEWIHEEKDLTTIFGSSQAHWYVEADELLKVLTPTKTDKQTDV